MRLARLVEMALILTAEDVVRRISAECAFVDERGGVGIRLRPAAAIVRQYGEQFRAPRRKQTRRSQKNPRLSDARLVKLLIRARQFNATLLDSDGMPFAALAKREGVSPSYFTRLVRLSYLAPDFTRPSSTAGSRAI